MSIFTVIQLKISSNFHCDFFFDPRPRSKMLSFQIYEHFLAFVVLAPDDFWLNSTTVKEHPLDDLYPLKCVFSGFSDQHEACLALCVG